MNKESLRKIELWLQKEEDELLYNVDEENSSFTWEDARRFVEGSRDFCHLPQWTQQRLRIVIQCHQITQEDERTLNAFFRENLYDPVACKDMPEHLQNFLRGYGTDETLWRLENTDARYHCFQDGSRAIDELTFIEVLP